MNWGNLWQGILGTVAAAVILGVLGASVSTYSTASTNKLDVKYNSIAITQNKSSYEKGLSEMRETVKENTSALNAVSAQMAAFNTHVEWLKERDRQRKP